jgi:hypothetical protein
MVAGLTDCSNSVNSLLRLNSRIRKAIIPLIRGAKSLPHWKSKSSQIPFRALKKALWYFPASLFFYLRKPLYGLF